MSRYSALTFDNILSLLKAKHEQAVAELTEERASLEGRVNALAEENRKLNKKLQISTPRCSNCESVQTACDRMETAYKMRLEQKEREQRRLEQLLLSQAEKSQIPGGQPSPIKPIFASTEIPPSQTELGLYVSPSSQVADNVASRADAKQDRNIVSAFGITCLPCPAKEKVSSPLRRSSSYPERIPKGVPASTKVSTEFANPLAWLRAAECSPSILQHSVLKGQRCNETAVASAETAKSLSSGCSAGLAGAGNKQASEWKGSVLAELDKVLVDPLLPSPIIASISPGGHRYDKQWGQSESPVLSEDRYSSPDLIDVTSDAVITLSSDNTPSSSLEPPRLNWEKRTAENRVEHDLKGAPKRKLIVQDDVVQPCGVEVKPSASQLKERVKRRRFVVSASPAKKRPGKMLQTTLTQAVLPEVKVESENDPNPASTSDEKTKQKSESPQHPAIDPACYDKYEKENSSPEEKYAYKETVRKQAERRKLHAQPCGECEKYFEAAASEEERAKRVHEACRHRHKGQPAQSTARLPAGYWDVDFMSTQECRDQGILNKTQYLKQGTRQRNGQKDCRSKKITNSPLPFL